MWAGTQPVSDTHLYQILRPWQGIAGIRVICYFVNDIYNRVNILRRQTDLVVRKEKDYIQSPKPNGYRSLHLVLGIPVYCLDTMEYFPVEVQFRTMALSLIHICTAAQMTVKPALIH